SQRTAEPGGGKHRLGAVFFEHALRERHYEHLAGRSPQDVLDGRGEEARLAAPPRRGAEDDQIRVPLARLVDDRLGDAPRPPGLADDLDAVLRTERTRLLEGLGGTLLLALEHRVDPRL